MTSQDPRIVSADRAIAAPPGEIFDLIADPAHQPRWDGNDNLAEAPAGQRVRGIGEVFTMTLTRGMVRENHVVEFDEGRRIAWTPAEPGQPPPGHLWRWELEPIDAAHTRVTHTYDWTRLTDQTRLSRARATTADRLRASLDRLAALAESTSASTGSRTDQRSPRILAISWGRMEVEGLGPGKDFKLYPGGGRAWDWAETGTRHEPGIQPEDTAELLSRGATTVVLSQGMDLKLHVDPRTRQFLDERDVVVHVAETREAVALYNRLTETTAVAGLFHSTC